MDFVVALVDGGDALGEVAGDERRGQRRREGVHVTDIDIEHRAGMLAAIPSHKDGKHPDTVALLPGRDAGPCALVTTSRWAGSRWSSLVFCSTPSLPGVRQPHRVGEGKPFGGDHRVDGRSQSLDHLRHAVLAQPSF